MLTHQPIIKLNSQKTPRPIKNQRVKIKELKLACDLLLLEDGQLRNMLGWLRAEREKREYEV